ncbi:hypothetical protein OOK31_32260 [Streptomyces sp. NBC_00249]|uniref:hypothetical protein n=1 Tax=Streptomyces sp. NBC_00249 TaxID=2975690 RepID=UPI002251CD2C|nr:hypothetical protein [Streptomyces sp. NBC_00249]MCX5198506.1 hypothetical protein [Streptomyces sp. NBC_00249]
MDAYPQVTALLHTLDRLPGPRHLCFPDGYDPARAQARAERLRARLEQTLGGPCVLTLAEDAGYYGTIVVPPRATQAGVPIAVRLSNYGDLAVVTTPAPDSHHDLDHAVAAGALTASDRHHIETALSDHYLVPLPPLHHLYDGVVTTLRDDTPRVSYGPHAGRTTWWTRFFEHL